MTCLLSLIYYIYFLLGDVLLLEHYRGYILNHLTWLTNNFTKLLIKGSSSQLSGYIYNVNKKKQQQPSTTTHAHEHLRLK